VMKIERDIPLLEEILSPWKGRMGGDYEGYKNHCYRMLHFCFYLHDAAEEERQKLIIAAAFHDLGIWSDNTIDYLPPSVALAQAYLREKGLEPWSREIELLIDQHHKLNPYRGGNYPLVEIFRRADLVDFSLGMARSGVPGVYVRQVKAAFPNAGFHKRLLQLAWQQLKKNPLNPAPMMKW
jgi:hypothetical protein